MERNKRTVTCGELTAAAAGRRAVLNGWVASTRDHGGIHFINLQDRHGVTQVVADDLSPGDVVDTAGGLRDEYCVAVVGEVRLRPQEMVNTAMATGEVEVAVTDIEVLSRCAPLPFSIAERVEELRLRYRYLTQAGFLEIETPTLIRSTPEGARDFIVPWRPAA